MPRRVALVVLQNCDNAIDEQAARLEVLEATLKTNAPETTALQTERDQTQQILDNLRTDREKYKQAVVAPDLALYEKLRVIKNGVALAQVVTGSKVCGKCRIDLPVAKLREVYDVNKVVTCPSCGRILTT